MRQPTYSRFTVCHLAFCFFLLLAVVPVSAQTLYITNTTSISTSQSYSNAFVGASNNLSSLVGNLTIDSGAVLSVTNSFLVANGTATLSNSVLLTGAGSELNAGRISVGEYASGNSMLVTNGALLRTDFTNAAADHVMVGFSGAASNNVLTVAGSGTSWVQTATNRTVNVGDNGDNNQLVIRDGAVVSVGGTILVGRVAAASGNSMLVTGAGTILTNRGILLGGGDGQSLVISDGAQVFSTATGSSSSDPSFSLAATFGALSPGQQHTALITGLGTAYTMSGGANIGLSGAASMVVSNGAKVVLTGSGKPVFIGSSASANGSSLLVTGSGTTWTNNANQWTIGGTANSNSSMVVSAGAVVSGGNGVEIGTSSNSTAGSLMIDAATFNLTNQVMRVGYRGSENRLVVTNGGVLNLSNLLYLGQGTSDVNGAHSNTVLVTGVGSSIVQASLGGTGGNFIGSRGRDNSLVVSNGATVVMGGPTAGSAIHQVGWDTNSSGNSLVVTDAGSIWGGRGDLEIGVRGSSNFVSALNGGLITNGTVRLGVSNSANANYLLVDGAGSIFSNRISMTVGNGTNTDNRINVTNGGVLHTGGSLNVQSNSTVNAAGSVWVGQGRASVQTVNVLHTNANSNSVLTVNGLVATEGTVTVGTRGVVGGTGTLGGLIVAAGGTVAPGSSPGTLSVTNNAVWNPGGNYNWEIHNAAGTAGTGWDLLDITGTLDLNALSAGNQFNINLWSLESVSPDSNGDAINFDPAQNYVWTIATAAQGVLGFSADKFTINSATFNGAGGFANSLDGGGFYMELDGNNLNLKFTTAIPEPGTWAAMAVLAAGAAVARWRKRAKMH